MCGDFEFETRCYGLSGASGEHVLLNVLHTSISLNVCIGRHCCLWCHIKASDLATPPSIRGPVVPRTIATLESDLANFQQNGSNLKNAKFYNNVTRKPFFPLPLDQVYMHTHWANRKHINIRFLTVGVSPWPSHQPWDLLSAV